MIHDGRVARHGARAQFQRRIVRDQLPSFGVVLIGQQGSERNADEVRIAVIGLAVGEGELGAFHHGVDELGAKRIHRANIEPAQQGKLLQEHRTLAPRTAFQHGVAVVVVRDRIFDGRRPASEVVGCQQAAMAAAGNVQYLVAAEETFRPPRRRSRDTRRARAASMRASRVAPTASRHMRS